MRQAKADPCDSTEIYWRDIQNCQPLGLEQETELFRRAKQGDEKAMQKIVSSNLRFVVRIAREYEFFSGLSLLELVSEGNFGLMEAVRRFDETRGFKFITYAVWWIKQAILKAISEQRQPTRPAMSIVADALKIGKKEEFLAQELGRFPYWDELEQSTGLSHARAQSAFELEQGQFSFDSPVHDDNETLFGDLYADPDQDTEEEFRKTELSEALAKCLELLSEREQKILRLYFGFNGENPMTLEQIGHSFGLTRERVRQLRDRALFKLRVRHGGVLKELARA